MFGGKLVLLSTIIAALHYTVNGVAPPRSENCLTSLAGPGSAPSVQDYKRSWPYQFTGHDVRKGSRRISPRLPQRDFTSSSLADVWNSCIRTCLPIYIGC